jgi:hypothetical protein
MTIIVKRDWRELGLNSVLSVDPVWIYKNCPLERGAEVFIWWHTNSRRPTELEMRGALSQFSHRGKSPTTGHPEASLQIEVTQRIIPTRRLTVAALDKKSDTPGLRTLSYKLKSNRHKKVAFLDTMEADYLRNFFEVL